MLKLLNTLPRYSKHLDTGHAIVQFAGKTQYLGAYGTKASRREFDRLVSEWVVAGRPSAPTPQAGELTIAELLIGYWRHAKTHYVKHGRATSEQDSVRMALRFVRELYDTTPAANFGPLALKAVRERMVAHGLARNTINANCRRIRRVFRSAASEELLPMTVWQALATLPGLQRGRTQSRESSAV